MNFKKNAFFGFLIAASLVFILLGQNHADEQVIKFDPADIGITLPKDPEKRKLFENEFKYLSDKSINIKGQVIDQEGNHLNDVKILANFSVGDFFDGGKSKRIKRFSSDGSFSIYSMGFISARLYFAKDGYFPAIGRYSLEPSKNITTPGILQEWLSKEYPNEVIVMQEIGPLATTTYSDIIWRVLIDNLSSPIVDLTQKDKPKLIPLKESQSELPEKYFHIIKGESNPSPEKWDPPDYYYYLKYHSDDPEDGFIVVNGAKDFRDLKDAPESGYNTQEILLSFTQNEDVYLFYRNGDKYGRIQLLPANLNVPRTRIFTRLFIITNEETDPASKRNLRSLER